MADGRDLVDVSNPPTAVDQIYGATVGPHAPTTRWTYTVPANKWAKVESVDVHILRVTAAAPVGLANVVIETIRNGIASNVIQLPLIKNVVGDVLVMAFAVDILLQAGEQLHSYTLDGSTGGTIDYLVSHHTLEYKA